MPTSRLPAIDVSKLALVKPLPDTLVVNIGDIVQVWSNDRYKAPLHRVVANADKEWFSVPFFFNPGYSTSYAPLPSTIDVLLSLSRSYRWPTSPPNRHRICPPPQSVRAGTLEFTSAAILAGSASATEYDCDHSSELSATATTFTVRFCAGLSTAP